MRTNRQMRPAEPKARAIEARGAERHRARYNIRGLSGSRGRRRGPRSGTGAAPRAERQLQRRESPKAAAAEMRARGGAARRARIYDAVGSAGGRRAAPTAAISRGRRIAPRRDL